MKRCLAFLLALCLLPALAGCGAKQAAASGDPEDSDLTVIGYCQLGAESDWRVANTDSIRNIFSEANGYELIFVDGQQKQENQIRAIRKFIQQQVDYIIFSPITETGWDEVLAEARDAGIPVIITDRMVDVTDDSLYAAFVGSDFRSEGDTAAAWLEDTLEAQGRADSTVDIVELQGTLGSSAQLGRTAGLAAGLDAHPNWVLSAQECGDFTNAKANEVMTGLLSGHIAMDVLVCQNDDMALGAMAAMDAAGVRYGKDGGVIVISFDATHAGLEDCLAGKISFDVECNPLQGPYVEQIVRQLEAGQTPARCTYVEEASFDAATISQNVIDARPY